MSRSGETGCIDTDVRWILLVAGNDVVVGLCTPEKIEASGGRRYIRARRPELYENLTEPWPEGQGPIVNPGWREDDPREDRFK